MKLNTKSVVFSVILFSLVLLCIEASLQVFYRCSVGMWLHEWWAIPIYEPDQHRVFRVKPNLDFTHKTREYAVRYYTDSQGMRTDSRRREIPVEKSVDTFRILSMGASFAFGWGVNYEDAYVYALAGQLRARGRNVEMMNLGTPSQPISYQLGWLRNIGCRYQPDMIIQTVYGSVDYVDPDDTLPPDGVCVKDGYLYDASKLSLKSWLLRIKRYSTILFYGWHIYEMFSDADATAGMGVDMYSRAGNSALSDGISATAGKYERYVEFVEKCLGRKIPVIFLHVPFAYTVRPSDIVRVKHRAHCSPAEERRKTADLQKVLWDRGIQLIDTTDVLIAGDKKSRMYYFLDIHLTPQGNSVVAAHVAPLLQKIVDEHVLKPD